MMYQITYTFLPLFESLIYFLLFEAFLQRRSSRSKKSFVIGYVTLAILIKLCNLFFIITFVNVFLVVSVIFCVASYFYEDSSIKKLMIAVLAFLMSGIAENFSVHLVAFIFSLPIEEVLKNSGYAVLSMLLSKLLAIFICNFIRIKYQAREYRIGYAYWFMFFLLFASAAFTMFLIARLTYELDPSIYPHYAAMTVICACGLFLSTFFSIYLYERLAKQSEAIRFQERYEEHLKFQLKHLNDLIAKQDEIRSMKHDMTNQLITLQGYFNRHDEEGGNAYIAQLLQAQQLESLTVNTGNIAFDTLVSTKKAVAEKEGIDFQLNVQISDQLFLQPVDQCVIFGNALDNAIEACRRCTEEEKKIDFFLVQRNNKLICKIKNPLPSHQPATLVTSKEDHENHGFGLKNLRNALARYDSVPHIEQKDGDFQLSFIVYKY